MAVDASKVDVAITGAISKAPLATALPIDASTALAAAFVDSGAISEDGFTLSLPDSGDTTNIKAWQNAQTLRTLRTPSDDLPTISFTMLETSKASVETYFATTVTQTVTEGSFSYAAATPAPFVYVADVIDGTKRKRIAIPRGVRAEVGKLVFKNDEPIGYEVTIECEYDSTSGCYFKYFDTALKS